MEKNKKITILSPCYNGETYIKRFFDSILNQTYKNIEVIFVDDGSIDGTKKIVDQYIKKFKKSNITFKYIYQVNMGQAAAIENGLQYVTGDYITWMDSDDFLTIDSLEIRIKFFEDNPNIQWVRAEANIVDELDVSKKIGILKKESSNICVDNLFEQILFPKNNFYFCPVCYMARTNALFEVLKDKKIYKNRGGQNWQLMLPLAHKYVCGYIPRCVGSYVVRDSSHSHEIINDRKKIIKRSYLHEELLVATLERIDDDKMCKYIKKVRKKYNWIRLWEAICSKDKKIFNDVYKNHTSLCFYYTVFNFIGINDFSYFIIRIMNKIKFLLFIPT